MRLGGRLAAAIEILADMDVRHRPASEALRDWGVSHRFAGSGDRAAIGNIVYDALRYQASSQWKFGETSARARAFGGMMTGFPMMPEELASMLGGDRFAPDALTEGEKAAWQTNEIRNAPFHVQAECPEWCVALLEKSFGDHWIEETRALAARPPLDLRVNTLKADRLKVEKALARIGAQSFRRLDIALRIPPISGHGRHPNVTAEPAFQKGWFEVQDCGSQAVSVLAAPEENGQVLDLCAGAGGKTLALAALMENRGQIHAYDSEKNRLAPIFERLRRAGTRNVQVHSADDDLISLESQMDVVLVDAPCSGSGTWRRRPDTKWRLTQNLLDQRVAEQTMVLSQAARYVKAGGELAYVTCSVFARENGDRIQDFLSENSGFEPVDCRERLTRRLPEMMQNLRHCDQHGLLFSPRASETDGFFFCLLRKVA